MPRFGQARPENVCYVSALTGQGIDAFVNKLEQIIMEGSTLESFFFPNSEGGALNTLYKNASSIENVEYGAEGITATAIVDAKTRGMLRKYLTSAEEETIDE